MAFLLALLIDGVLTGAIYALIALAFVVVYKSTRIINFALGDWIATAARVVAGGLNTFGLGLGGSLLAAVAAMAALALLFSRFVLSRMVGRPLIALLMATIGLGALLRGGGLVLFAGVPGRIEIAPPGEAWRVADVGIAPEKLFATAVALLGVGIVAWFFQRSRIGVALRAIADDQQAAMAAGIDIDRYLAIVWVMMAAICVVAGTLWAIVSGGGFGMALVGLKIFPIVILGGLDSIRGCLVGAIAIGVAESLVAGYLDPLVGAGFGNVCSYALLIAVLFLRPAGLFGSPPVQRV
jgi:branched-chain amino acid transport system permease protein